MRLKHHRGKLMSDQIPVDAPVVAIVDCGLGNLHSVKQACRFVHLNGIITSDKKTVLDADAVILPGVGAFGHAMDKLNTLDLVGVLRDVAVSKKPLIGICLGLQLFMSKSYEFGSHQGLNIFEGSVVPFDDPEENGRKLKIPHVGWNRIYPYGDDLSSAHMFKGISDGEYMYFVHSYVVRPENSEVKATRTKYGNIEFCSSIHKENIWGFQFFPERSGAEGLKIYQNFADHLYSTANGECPCQ